jgi:enoyl-CoA hydratase/carnithine racemase
VIRVEKTRQVVTLTIERPEKRNALRTEEFRQLDAALREAASDSSTLAVVITSAGGSFCAGQDLRELSELDPEALADHPFHSFIECLAFHPKVLLAAVEGSAVGVGLTILLHCDFVVAAADAQFRTPFVELGSTAEAASSVLAPAVMGARGAARMLLLCDWLDAPTAQASGLVTEVVDSGQVEQRALATAATVAAMPPESLLSAKRLLVKGRRDDVAAALARERQVLLQLYRQERIRASAARFAASGRAAAG